MSASIVTSRRFQRTRAALLAFSSAALLTVTTLPSQLDAQVNPSADTTALPGSVSGTLIAPSNLSSERILVTVEGAGKSALTNTRGVFVLQGLPPGTYTLVAQGSNFSTLRITNVVIRPARDLTLSPLDMPRVLKGTEVQKMEQVEVRAKQDVIELDKYEVKDTKVLPYSDANIDLPRSVNDVQPYQIFEGKFIAQSGAATIEEFLANNLTSNVLRSTNSGNTTSYGTNSDVNLRGLGVDRTLILINGRRMPNNLMLTSNYQTDINGISPGMIDRIVVLPTSASGIYGGNALGGVVNIILKKNSAGGEVWANYQNTFDGDAYRRTLGMNLGIPLEGGRTNVMLSLQYTDANTLRMQDRADIIRENYAKIIRNNPDHLYTVTSAAGSTAITPFGGATTNIANSVVGNLILDNGTELNSRITHIPAGFSPSATVAQLNSALIQDSGRYNLTLPSIYLLQTGLGSYFGFTPESRAVTASVTRKMFKNVEMYVDYSFKRNKGVEPYSSYFNTNRTVPATAPTNPFTTAVIVRMPAERLRPRIGLFDSETIVAGFKVTLPHDWIAEVDYTHVKNVNDHRYEAVNDGAVNTALASGAINPFADTQLFPVSLDAYANYNILKHGASQNSFAARASGQLMKLPWGTPILATAVENRLVGNVDGSSEAFDLTTRTSATRSLYLGLKQIITSAYVEVQTPLVEKGRIPFVHDLELQLAGRTELVEAATGTASGTTNTVTGVTTYAIPTVGGRPVRGRTRYESTNPTIGFKYQPVPSVIFRASWSTGYQPPTNAQLMRNPEPSTTTTNVLDPLKGTTYGVLTIAGGNAEVKPQSSESWNAGIIFEPRSGRLRDLRLNAEYYEIKQSDAITNPAAQITVNLFPERVTRDASGNITLVDTSALNLYGRDMSGWDFTADYRWRSRQFGSLAVHAVQSLILHTRTQYNILLPSFEGVNFPIDTSIGGALRQKSNVNLNWEHGRYSAGWAMRVFSDYRVYGSAGGPLSMQNANGANFSTYASAQGTTRIPSQDFHDIFFGYRFGAPDSAKGGGLARILEGMSLTLGIRNIFDAAPEFDVGPFGLGFMSPFADVRMREYWINLRRTF